ncbi:MAG: Ig-like domain-containing protein, partial [Paramuribaculum sp.]|nr:Ig-like domain-containing protein [Paramuribaculum sp.]
VNPSQTSPHPSTYFLIGPAVTEIAANAFFGCESLVSVTVPDNVVEVGASAFGNCAKLQRIVLGTEVTTLGTDIFSDCPVLKEIIIKGGTCIEPYKPIISECTIYVNDTLIDRYEESLVWDDLDNTFLPLLPISLSLTYNEEEVPEVISLPLDQKITLNAKMLGQELLGTNATDQPVHYWTSSDETVASVGKNGIITGLSLGTTNITVSATFDFKQYSRTCEIAVGYDAPTAIKITAPEEKMALGTTLTLSADVIPSGALQQFTWSCLTPNLASISESGVITPKAKGKATFKATSSVNPAIVKTVTIDIHYAKATSVDLNIESDTLRIGDTAQMTCTVNPYPYASQAVQWFTSDEKVATVSQTGSVECVGLGKVIISAMCLEANHIVGTKELYVDYSIPTYMLIATPELDMKIGDVRQIQFTVEPAGAEQRADWVSEDEDVATVDANGNVTAVGVGTTLISGTTGSVKASCAVTVDYADPVRVVLNLSGVNINIGDSTQLVARILPVGARQEIIWSIDD